MNLEWTICHWENETFLNLDVVIKMMIINLMKKGEGKIF